ncbi:MAG: hypothetical protein ACLUQ6_05315 [Alistipes onderdonkii]
MKYYSTKDKACARAFSLREAVQAGLAPDGGLFVPERIPQADMADRGAALAGESYAALAGYLAELFSVTTSTPVSCGGRWSGSTTFRCRFAVSAAAIRWSSSTARRSHSRITVRASWGG